jgi:hypothetical protein
MDPRHLPSLPDTSRTVKGAKKATPRGATIRAAGRKKNSGSDLLSHMETMQYHRL